MSQRYQHWEVATQYYCTVYALDTDEQMCLYHGLPFGSTSQSTSQSTYQSVYHLVLPVSLPFSTTSQSTS